MNSLRQAILATFRISPSELNRIIATAPHRYKSFYIPKKRAGSFREVAQPARELKAIQTWLIQYLENRLPMHSCAVAYRNGTGIKENAKRHTNKRFVLKMDLKDFFPSIVKRDIQKHLAKYFEEDLSGEDVDDICNILLWSPPNKVGRRLCIGAPSSPFISNSILYDLDELLWRTCLERRVTYTRYADDLIFSTNEANLLSEIERAVYRTLSEIDYPKLSVNQDKTVHTSKGRGVTVTGITVTPLGGLSIGRERKRLIRAAIYRFLEMKLSYEEVEKLNGLLAFAHDIEPAFIQSMKNRYGSDILLKIRAHIADNAPGSSK